MAPLELEGDTLGQKHKHFNKLVHEAVSKQATEVTLSEDDDIQNLLKIDVACKTRNVGFLLEVLKCEDLLYVSRAIKNSKWLVTDKEYSHVVNPEYLHTNLSPQMTTKAFNKLMLSIRLNLKDTDRVEGFYKYVFERDIKASYKWLQHCSVPFIINELKVFGKHIRTDPYHTIPAHLTRRLVERSLSIFEAFMKISFYTKDQLIQETIFLANNDTEKYLDALESRNDNRSGIKCNKKITTLLMTRCSKRVLDKFEFYAGALHLPTFVKYLKEHENIETFLLKQAEKETMKWFFTYHYMKPFITQMPEDSKFKFVKNLFIDKKPFEVQKDWAFSCRVPQAFSMLDNSNKSNRNIYQWYKLAPFDEAFVELKKCIRTESSPVMRNTIIQVLLSCAGQNMTHVRTVLKYLLQKHINEPFKFKIQFVNAFISKYDTLKFDDETWELLNQLYQSVEVYIESENNVQSCIKSIIVHHVIRGEKIPDIVNNKFTFDSMKQFQHKLKKQEEKDALFTYLFDYMVEKNQALNIDNPSELENAIELCKTLLTLLLDWKKELQNYPYVIERTKYLCTIKQEKSWDVPINSLYNVNKSWRKFMFEDSIIMSPTQEACVNALKHDPVLLVRHKTQVENILKNDGLVLTSLLSKVRIYWPNSLAEEWKSLYSNGLEKPGGHKAVIIGLCTLLNQNQLNDVIKKYAPPETKIDWHEINEHILSLQKLIGKNMWKARPLCPLENILWYAKGDYLQFAVPSLNSVLNQLSANKVRKFTPRLLDAPVSLQKFGVRHAFNKLDSQELKPIFTRIWNSTKNSTIRTVLFTHTHALLCREKKTDRVNDLWELMSMFIDNLSTEENKVIYQKLGKALETAQSIKYKVFMKSYTFLKSLPAKADCESIVKNMENEAPDIMEFLDDDFVVNVLLKNTDQTLNNTYDARIVASFIIGCRNEETASRRYELFLAPLLDKSMPMWYKVHKGFYFVKNNIIDILTKLVYLIDVYILDKKCNIPVKTFQKILSKLEAGLSLQRDYVFLTTWKLATKFIQLLDEHKTVLHKLNVEDCNDSRCDKVTETFTELHLKIGPHFAKYCVGLLKEDMGRFYPSIYTIFAQTLKEFFDNSFSHRIFQTTDYIEYLKCLLLCCKDKEVYLVVYYVLPTATQYIFSDDQIKKRKEIREVLYSHPSEELKMHYYQLFSKSTGSDSEFEK